MDEPALYLASEKCLCGMLSYNCSCCYICYWSISHTKPWLSCHLASEYWWKASSLPDTVHYISGHHLGDSSYLLSLLLACKLPRVGLLERLLLPSTTTWAKYWNKEKQRKNAQSKAWDIYLQETTKLTGCSIKSRLWTNWPLKNIHTLTSYT